MSDEVLKAGFDHPCKQTCSGWQQGFERGKLTADEDVRFYRREWESACDRLKGFEQDHLEDWKRIQDAERRVARFQEALETIRDYGEIPSAEVACEALNEPG